MKQVLLINKGWADNLGDQVIKFALEDLLKRNNCKVDFVDFTEHVKKTYTSYYDAALNESNKQTSSGIKRFIKKHILKNRYSRMALWLLYNRKVFKNVNTNIEYDLIIIGGGQLIQGNSTFAYAMYFWVRFLKKRFKNARIIVLGVGAGGDFSSLETNLYKNALSKIDKLYIRDYDSINLIKNKFKIHSHFIHDVGFNVNNAYKISCEKEDKVLIGITDYLVYKRYNNDHMSKDDYYKFWKNQIIDYRSRGYRIELFYTTVRDLAETIKLKDRMSKQHNIELNILFTDTLEELLTEIAKASILVSGRMHGLIIGYAYGCEVIPYLISDKLKSFDKQYLNNFYDIEVLNKNIKEVIKEEVSII